MKKTISILFLIFVLTVPAAAGAQALTSNACFGTNGNSNIGQCVNQIYTWSLGAAALLALIMIIFGGYITLTSAGNAERATRGKSFIWSSLVGLILLFGAYLLLDSINPDLVNFNITSFSNSASTTQTTTTPTTNVPPRSQ